MQNLVTLMLHIEAPNEYDAIEVVINTAVEAFGPEAFCGIFGEGHGVPDTERIQALEDLVAKATGHTGDDEVHSGVLGLAPGDPDPES